MQERVINKTYLGKGIIDKVFRASKILRLFESFSSNQKHGKTRRL